MSSLFSFFLRQRQQSYQQAFNATRAYEWNERLRARRDYETRQQISQTFSAINQAFSAFSTQEIDYRANQVTVIGSEERGGGLPWPFASGRWETRTVVGIDVEHGDGFNTVGRIRVPISSYVIRGTDGDDRITLTGNTADTIYCNDGDDFVSSGDGNDTVLGGDGFDTIDAGEGDNYIHAGDGGGVVQSGDGDDHIIVGQGNHTIDAGDGDNRVEAYGVRQLPFPNDPDCGEEGFIFDEFPCGPAYVRYVSLNTIRTGIGNDRITATGDTNVHSLGGNNTIRLSHGRDVVETGNGHDVIYLGSFDDFASSGGGSDWVFSQDGNDILAGDAGRDRLNGGRDDDVLIGGSGVNDYVGGSGADTFSLSRRQNHWRGVNEETFDVVADFNDIGDKAIVSADTVVEIVGRRIELSRGGELVGVLESSGGIAISQERVGLDMEVGIVAHTGGIGIDLV